MANPAAKPPARTTRKVAFALTLVAALLLPAARPASGQVFGLPDDPGRDQWKSVLTPYFWAINQTGTRTVGPFEVPIDISFGDIWSNLKFGGSLHYVGKKGSWGVVLDAGYLNTEEKDIPIREFLQVDTLSASYNNKSFQGAASVIWGPFELSNQTLDFLAGIRYTRQDTDLSIALSFPTVSAARNFDKGWVDPIIGARWGIGFGKHQRWQASARADIGGFGVGSKFAFNSEAGIGYRLTRLLSLDVLFRYLYMNYESGTAGSINFYQQKTDQFGILVGVGFWW